MPTRQQGRMREQHGWRNGLGGSSLVGPWMHECSYCLREVGALVVPHVDAGTAAAAGMVVHRHAHSRHHYLASTTHMEVGPLVVAHVCPGDPVLTPTAVSPKTT